MSTGMNIEVDKWVQELEKVEFPKIKPSGTSCFKLDTGGYEITVIKNDIMQDGYALVSSDIYEKMYSYFNKLSEPNQQL